MKQKLGTLFMILGMLLGVLGAKAMPTLPPVLVAVVGGFAFGFSAMYYGSVSSGVIRGIPIPPSASGKRWKILGPLGKVVGGFAVDYIIIVVISSLGALGRLPFALLAVGLLIAFTLLGTAISLKLSNRATERETNALILGEFELFRNLDAELQQAAYFVVSFEGVALFSGTNYCTAVYRYEDYQLGALTSPDEVALVGMYFLQRYGKTHTYKVDMEVIPGEPGRTMVAVGTGGVAVGLYNNDITGNSALEAEAAACMENYLSDIKSGVLSGKYESTEAEIKKDTVKNVCSLTRCNSKNYDTLIREIDEAFASKVAYKSGVAFYESGDYAAAIGEFPKVIPEDGDYTAALEMLASQKYRDQLLGEAKENADKNDYIKALEILKSGFAVLPDDADLAAQITVYENNYISLVLSRAEQAFTDYTKYEEALQIIRSGLQHYPESRELNEKISYYNSYMPVKLSSLKEYDSDNISFEKNREDSLGNNHHTVYEVRNPYFQNSTESGYIVYVLDGKYNILTLTIFGVYPNRNNYCIFSLRDYSGGNFETSTMLYNDESIKCSVLPYEISVDVTGVQMLRLYCTDGIAVGDCVLQKTVK